MSLHITLTQPAVGWGMDAGDTEREPDTVYGQSSLSIQGGNKSHNNRRSSANSKHVANREGPWH